MSQPVPIRTPGGFAPALAVGQTDDAGHFALVGPATPLAVRLAGGHTPPPLEGSAGSAVLVGPFVPAPFVPVFLTLSGEWTGTVRLLRSVDGGATRRPLTLAGSPWGVFSANACEPMWQESETGAALYLDCAPTSGSIGYRLAQ